MNNKKLSIRPELNLTSTIPDEDFQNRTLRPVLKLQHDLDIMLFISFCDKQKIDFLKDEKKFNSIVNIHIKKNMVLKNQYLGLIIGQFTTEEFATYIENDSEFNKRIITMIGQRLKDSQSEIKDYKTNNNDNRTKN